MGVVGSAVKILIIHKASFFLYFMLNSYNDY